ncbi:MAG: hypothetical protein RLZZ400_992 [Actinomycetota bacterium]
MSADYDVVVVGGGHNGLVASCYLAKAGKRVLVLEKESVLGGAAISTRAFEGVDARLSRYSYLVSLLPDQIVRDLELEIELAPRRFGSFTPDASGERGLLIDKLDASVTKQSFDELRASGDFDSWNDFYEDTEKVARVLFPTVLQPLPTESEVRQILGEKLWKEFFVQPIGRTIEARFENDVVRGVVMTDALIGTFASNHDKNLDANKCFLYHVIGNETGEWRIPVGGMGAVTGSMAKRAAELGVDLLVSAQVTSVTADGKVTYLHGALEQTVSAGHILANVSRPTLERIMGGSGEHSIGGAQVKVNMVLKRLPKLRSGVDPVAAFGGTFHINESYSQLQTAFEQASRGEIPNPLPLEIYCHSLTDPSILGEGLRESGAQTLTVFALHTPHSLLSDADNDAMRARFEAAAIDSINSVLAEDIRELLLTDANGAPCIETKTTLDLEEALGLPGGNIFHAPLSWPFVSDGSKLDTPEKRWGVDSGYERIFFCGSTARRGGAVSGIGGHNAAMAILES